MCACVLIPPPPPTFRHPAIACRYQEGLRSEFLLIEIVSEQLAVRWDFGAGLNEV